MVIRNAKREMGDVRATTASDKEAKGGIGLECDIDGMGELPEWRCHDCFMRHATDAGVYHLHRNRRESSAIMANASASLCPPAQFAM